MSTVSAVEWAREHGEHYIATTDLDNYEPVARNTTRLDVYQYNVQTRSFDAFIIVDAMDELRDANKASYVVDDGATLRLYYVAGWHETERYVIIHPWPVDDYWTMGPRRTYHLKVRLARTSEASRPA